MDVQHRLLLECAWVALENAGHDPEADDRRYGMFAGIGMNRYLLRNLMPHRGLIEATDPYQLMLANDKDFAATRTSYKLNLRGPSISVQTACSTSLVAVHLACQSLLAGECDTALAGGCSVTLPQDRGYLHQEGMILSPDGHCRAFDIEARGTVGGNGVGLVVLKPLEQALADGDGVYGVIKGSAINNDGSSKAGYAAPGVSGQVQVISDALAAAGVEPNTIGYIEAHGTGTPLGDPIEIAALTRVFRATTARTGYCAIGSVKTNLGHLDSAAGVAGLIKTVLAVKHGVVPPSLHFREPNPALELRQSPFFVPTELRPWPADVLPRRAGVSSFGIGGTNAHVVLEQAPEPPPCGPSRPFQLLLLSARRPAALDSATARLARHLGDHPALDPADVAFTLASGRRAFDHRRILVCRTLDEAAEALDGALGAGQGQRRAPRVHTSAGEPSTCSVAFMFSGQGSQYVDMAAEIYRGEPVFREQVDRCAVLLQPQLNLDLRGLLYPAEDQAASAHERLKQTAIAQPALFVVEMALAQLWISWGVRPEALIGHSLGEYAAACVAGVWTLEDALTLVAARAELMQRQPVGSMLTVSLPEAEVRNLLRPGLSLAAVNGPELCVVSGARGPVAELARELQARGIACRPLNTSHAFHSAMMEEAAEPFLARLREVECRPPEIPFVSNVTGTWIEPKQAVDPDYWVRHLRDAVRFADGLETLLQDPGRCLIELGPGNTLGTLALRHPRRSPRQTVLTSLRHPQEKTAESAHLMEAAGRLWLAGGQLDWAGFYSGQRRQRLPLPTYPFERQRYWIDPPGTDAIGIEAPDRKRDIDDWFYVPSWQRAAPRAGEPEPGTHWLLFMDMCGVGGALAGHLARRGIEATRVHAGLRFARREDGDFVLDPGSRGDYELLLGELHRAARLPDVVVHLWNVTPADAAPQDSTQARDRSFYSLVFFAQCLGDREIARPCRIVVVSTGLHDVTGEEHLHPAKALLLGPVTNIPQEYRELACSSIDLSLDPRCRATQIEHLLADAAVPDEASVIAYRGSHRWVQIFVPSPLPEKPPPVRPGGVYLITGGTGGVGLVLAKWLARGVRAAKLVLLARSEAAGGAGAAARLEQLGAEVLVLRADVASAAQMQSALAAINARFGALHGVIQAAGIPGGGLIALATREDAERQFAAKVDGTLLLESLLAGAQLDFFVLCSSVTSILGGAGQVAYTAACAFQDAWAQVRAAQGAAETIVSINWDRWEKVGMAAAAEARFRELTGNDLPAGMHPDEATAAFGRLLAAAPAPRIVVSLRDVAAERARSRGFQLAPAGEPRAGLSLHVRPDGAGDYVVPANDTERLIAGIWQEELGIDRVGARDDFFTLGGDSLSAIRLIARLRQALAVPLDARVLYDAPTVAALGEHVAAVRWAAQAGDARGAAEREEEGVL
jgi:acyl transferase domain-containing protein/acyl carrier protein